jgi:hypothetical protein
MPRRNRVGGLRRHAAPSSPRLPHKTVADSARVLRCPADLAAEADEPSRTPRRFHEVSAARPKVPSRPPLSTNPTIYIPTGSSCIEAPLARIMLVTAMARGTSRGQPAPLSSFSTQQPPHGKRVPPASLGAGPHHAVLGPRSPRNQECLFFTRAASISARKYMLSMSFHFSKSDTTPGMSSARGVLRDLGLHGPTGRASGSKPSVTKS